MNITLIPVVSTVPDWATDLALIAEWQKQDVLQAVGSQVARRRGSVTDESVRQAICEIIKMDDWSDQCDAFDLLYTLVWNGHARGICAPVLNEISDAWNECYRRSQDHE